MPRPPSTPAREPDRRLAWVRLGGLAAALAATFALAALFLGHDEAELRRAVDDLGAWAPVAFVALGAVLTCVFFPFPLIAAASGVLFGTAWGTVVSIASGTLGAVLAFSIARAFGAGPVRTLAPPRLEALLEAVGRRGFVAVLYLRIFPGVPRDIANYLCGLTPVATRDYVLATLIGISPRAFAYTALGGSFGDLTSPEAVVAVALLVAVGILGIVLLRREVRPPGSAGGSSSRASPTGGRR